MENHKNPIKKIVKENRITEYKTEKSSPVQTILLIQLDGRLCTIEQ